jgi:hypothetical protein
MKLITSILIALIFTLFWILKFEWYFELWKVNLVDIDWTFEIDLSYIKHTTDYIFYIPELIFDTYKDYIREYFIEDKELTNQEIYISIIFIFHFLFVFLLTQFLRIFAWYTDKKYIATWITIMYFLSIYFVRYYINL